MYYIRTSSGSMMAITHKTNALASEKKPAAVVKPLKRSKKRATSESK